MKTKQIIKNILLALVLWCTGTLKTTIDEKNLDTVALIQGYGYKYANLRELETLCASMHDKAYTLAVPIFVGIPSGTVQQFLKDLTPLDIASFWKNIITQYFPTAEIQKQTLKSKQYPDGFLHMCEVLEQRIKDEFNTIIQQVQPDFNFNNTFKVHGQDIDGLILTIANKKERLMVRSTGKEDTKKLANAGGNESVSNVDPTTKEILSAMRDVVASYFGKKSLIQRLGAGDESLFELTPFTPVLIQRMIGEQAQQLPKCGVMFTEEPEGGISILELKNPNGSIKTTGITVIQAAYGHNEGVVNSLIPVDTFYVVLQEKQNEKEGYIYPIIRPKTYRMAPAAARTLELKKNEGRIVTDPALNASAITVLKKFSDLLERHYQGPMDVEFVVNEQEKTMYIVQARPIVHNPNLPKPSYIINPDTIPDDQKLFGSAIGVAGGALRWCAGKTSVVVASTIGHALTMYQDLGVQGAAIQCIIVGEMAPATSHEATTFRSEGKPVVYIKELNVIEQWLEDPATTLVVSPQQGLVINWQGKENSVQELLATHIATHGWVSYPVPPFISVSKDFASSTLLTDEAIISLLPTTVGAKQFMQTLAENAVISPKSSVWKDYLHRLKTGTSDEVAIVLATLLYEIRDAIMRKSKDIILDEDTQNRIALLQHYALSIAHQIKASAHYGQTDPDYTKRLLPIRFLESLLYQQPLLTEIVDGYSVVTLVAKELTAEQAIIQELQALGITPNALGVQYLKIRQTAMTPELEQKWTQFIIDFTKGKDQETKNRFGHMILNLGKLNMLPIWLHTSFAHAYKPELSATNVAQKLINEYASQVTFLKMLFEKKAIIDALNKDAFGDPKKFATQWKTFNTDLLTYFLSNDDFIASFKKANDFGKLAALSVMQKFVDAFDLSIKAVTGRPKDNVHEIITQFKTMLDGYAALFKIWVTLVPEGAIRYSGRSALSAYIEFIDTILNKPSASFTAEDLKTTAFNVSAFTIGSGVDFVGSAIVHPSTLENIFTMVHQCLLVTLSTLNAQAGIKNIELPEPLQIAAEKLSTLKNIGRDSPELIGVEFTEKVITLFYNLPLRDHSIQIKLSYNKKTDAIKLALNFFGDNMHSRWDLMYGTALLLKLADIFNIDEIHKSNDDFKLALLMDTKSDNKDVYDNLQKIIDYSYDPTQIFDFTTIPDIDQVFERTIKYAEIEMQSTDQKRQIDALSTFEILASQGQAIEQAQQYAINATQSTDSRIQALGLNLLATLINRKRKIPEAESIALKAIQSTDIDNIQYPGLLLLGSLINQGHKIPEAQSIAVKAAQSTDEFIQRTGLNLIITLINQGHKIPETESIAIKAAQSIDEFIQQTGLSLIITLINQGHKIPEAESITIKAAQSTNGFIQTLGLNLLSTLINQGHKIHDIKATESIVIKATQSTTLVVEQQGLNLLTKLINRGHKIDDAEAIAAKAMQSISEGIQQSALNLLTALINKGHKTHEAVSIAIKAVQSTNYAIQQSGSDLLRALMEHGYKIPDAESVAIKATQSQDQSLREVGLDLLIKLINEGHVISDAESIANNAIASLYQASIQLRGYNLLNALRNAGYSRINASQLATSIIRYLVNNWGYDAKQPESGLQKLKKIKDSYGVDLKPLIESLLQDPEVSKDSKLKKQLEEILNVTKK